MRADSTPLEIAWVYDMDACRGPTGVTRHALAQLEGLGKRPDVNLKLVSGRISEPDGLARWESLDGFPRKELPLRTRDALRFWRLATWPPIETWTGKVDWIYAPAEYFVPAKHARVAVTSHDVLQDLRFGGIKRRERLKMAFDAADLILSVSKFNTDRLLEAFPDCADRVSYVPNGADELFYESSPERDRLAVRNDLNLPADRPYLLSVANFQARKNLPRLIRACGRLPEVASGDLAVVLIGEGSESEADPIREAIAGLDRRAIVRLAGYRQGSALRAAYSRASALVFASTCESFGIPAVEAMAQNCPVALANSTALPEVGGESAWYFDPEDESAIASTIREMLDHPDERRRRSEIGRAIAEGYRWSRSTDLLVSALRDASLRPKRFIQTEASPARSWKSLLDRARLEANRLRRRPPDQPT